MTTNFLTPILGLFMHDHVVRLKIERLSLTEDHPTCCISGKLLTLTSFSKIRDSVSPVAQAQPMCRGHQLSPAAVAAATVAVDMLDGNMEKTRKKRKILMPLLQWPEDFCLSPVATKGTAPFISSCHSSRAGKVRSEVPSLSTQYLYSFVSASTIATAFCTLTFIGMALLRVVHLCDNIPKVHSMRILSCK